MSRDDHFSCSVVIPVYNGALTLPELAARLDLVMPQICNSFEVLLVIDGSPDNSWQVVQELSNKYDFIRGIRLMKNYGQHNAILCGIREANGDVIITMDDDFSILPKKFQN